MVVHGAARLADDLARVRQGLFHQRGVRHLLGDAAGEQIGMRTPGLQCRLLARRRDIGVVKPD